MQGYEDRFAWNLEAQGVLRGSRIMQKRGCIIQNDDYKAVTGTYPDHPDKDVVPTFATRTELLADRMAKEQKDIRGKKQSKDQKIADIKSMSFKDYYRPGEYVANPVYTSIVQKNATEKREKRLRAGLTSVSQDIDAEKLPDPTLKWVGQPQNVSMSILADQRRQETLRDQ